ncbi:MAG: hypothetical protein U0527_05245 [Candidatus Eisenbacteria bacterium]
MSESSNTMHKTESLYERLGGREIVREIVERFFERVREDADLKSVYDHPNLDWLKDNQVDFLSRALGGPALSPQYEQQEAHADLWKEERYFFSLAAHLRGAMLSIGIAPLRIDEVVATLSPWSTQHEAVISSKSYAGWNGGERDSAWDAKPNDWFGQTPAPAESAPGATTPARGGDEFTRNLEETVDHLEALAACSHQIEESNRLAGERQKSAEEALRSLREGLTRLTKVESELASLLERGRTLGHTLHQAALRALLLGLRPDLASERNNCSRQAESQAIEMEQLISSIEERVTGFQAEELMLRGSLEGFRQVLQSMRGTEGALVRELEERLQEAEALGRSIESAVPSSAS